MAFRPFHWTKFFLACIAITLGVTLLLALIPLTPEKCACHGDPKSNYNGEDDPAWGAHKLAVIVPFRDRYEELFEFVPYLHSFLNKQHLRHKIFVINQVDTHRFNRASLINVGFLEREPDCDYIAMHDVDLLPLNENLSYSYPEHGPFHIASPELHPRYHYKTFVGGILLIKREHFELVNGLSNKYWGWGLEDDEFYVRMIESKLNITRPKGITTGYQTFRHIHDRKKRKRDMTRLHNQIEQSRRRDRITGLRNVKYTIDGKHDLMINNGPCVFINVQLICDASITPWCDLPVTGNPGSTLKQKIPKKV